MKFVTKMESPPKKREKRILEAKGLLPIDGTNGEGSQKDESKNRVKVALYARVSSRESLDRQDPENQLIILRRRVE